MQSRLRVRVDSHETLASRKAIYYLYVYLVAPWYLAGDPETYVE